MTDQPTVYSNPRIDRRDSEADALTGAVHADAVKILWVGSMFVLGTFGSAAFVSFSAVAVFLVSTIVTLCLGHSIGMHRLFIHRSFNSPQWLEYLLVHFGVLVGLAGPLGMLRTHDTRDWAQRQSQCHDYYSHGQNWLRDMWWQLFSTMSLKNPPELQIEPEIANDAVYQIMERTWMLQQLPWAILFYWLGGWGWVFWGVCSRVSISVLGHWLIGYFAHNDGDRDWEVRGAAVQGHNIRWCALITMGESWHNNHHAFPGSAKLGIKDGQWDPGWWVLQFLEKLGIVRNLVLPESLPERADLLGVPQPNRL